MTTAMVEFAAPYPGLRPFLAEEAPLFFGRGTHIAELIKILGKLHFLAVVGSSGCGKSSLVRAGLLPALQQGYVGGPDTQWRFVIMRPGGSPYANLARELVQALSEDGEADDETVAFRQATLRAGPRGLLDAVSDCMLPESARVLILVDQFEEIFRYRPGFIGETTYTAESEQLQLHNEALGFVDLLLSTAGLRDPRVYVALTMRSDFLGDCDAFRDLPTCINQAQFLTPRLTREELRDAIERPPRYEQFGGEIQPTVTAELINAMGERQDQLPLIQHALLRMWNFAREDRVTEPGVHITRDHLHRCGGVAQALNQHAEEIYNSLGGQQQRIAERLFCSLCQQSGEGRLVRRLTTVGEVAATADEADAKVMAVAGEFMKPGRNFLDASPSGCDTPAGAFDSSSTLDIGHESLIRHWDRLQRWVELEEESATRFRRLVESARLHARGEGELLRGRELLITQQWYEERKPTAVWGERYAPGAFAVVENFLRSSHRRRTTVIVGLGAFVAIAAFVGLFIIRDRIQKEEAETRVQVVMDAPPESVADAIEKLEEFQRRVTPTLEETFDNESTAFRRRLRAAVALAGLGKLDRQRADFLLESISQNPKDLEGECSNIVRALSSFRDSPTDQLLLRMEQEDNVEIEARNWSIVPRVRYASVGLHLGDARPAKQLLKLAADPSGRTAFIYGYAQWHGDLGDLPRVLRGTTDSAFRSGLCLALGRIPYPDLSIKEQQKLSDVLDVLTELYLQAPDGGTHSAAGWSLRQWGRQELPSIEPTRSAPTNRDWFVNGHGMTMTKIPAGSFTMGDEDDKTTHQVSLTSGCFVCDREVTVKQFGDFRNDRKYQEDHYPGKKKELWQEHDEHASPTDDCPVQNVSWYGAVLFCNWLSEQEERHVCYTFMKDKHDEDAPVTVECDFKHDGYRLPTEAEWEYACRSQTQTPFTFGNDEKLLNDYGYYYANSKKRAWPGGLKMPNGWGLFDMHGNVWEWCWDWHRPYNAGDTIDPTGPTSAGSSRVMRGGGWFVYALNCRSAFRNRRAPHHRVDSIGFRVVCGG